MIKDCILFKIRKLGLSKVITIFNCKPVSNVDLERVMKDIELSNKTVFTDKEPSMIAYMNTLENVNHLTFKSSDMKKGILEDVNVHNNNINSMMAKLGTWFKNFRVVSTKYLENYLKWFRFINLFKLKEIKEMVEYTLSENKSYQRFKNQFKTYQEFVIIKESNFNVI